LVKAVIDTNVLISALVGHGKPRQLVHDLIQDHTVVSSRDMLVELADVLTRDKFTEIDNSHINSLLTILARKSIIVDLKQTLRVVAEDPEDNMVLETAHEGNARYVVTGDKHLLRLKEYRGIEMVTVRQMLELLKKVKDQRE
jgi:putative PIN family toxin of toxin-antitoxin system